MVYISHLSIDMLIAIVATFWVLFVFSISGWLVSFIPIKSEIERHESLEYRNKAYADRAVAAIKNPTGKEEMRNIYFGMIMGFSAIIPTCVHIFCALFSLRFFLGFKKYNKLIRFCNKNAI